MRRTFAGNCSARPRCLPGLLPSPRISSVDDQAILDRVRALIAAGHHRDEVPGRPGVALSGGGVFRGNRRLYWRGTPEFAAAEAHGLLDRLPPPPGPASPAAIAEIETLVGARLPHLLRQLYGVANGGFGPGYGLLGLRYGFTDGTQTAVDLLADGLWPGMPAGLLPLCHWGCAIYSFVHLPSERIFGWDSNPVEPDDEVPFFAQEYLFRDWIEAWLEGSLRQPWLIYDPETGVYRGATNAETMTAFEEDA